MQIAYVTGFLFLSVLAYIYLKKAKIPYTIGLVIIGIFISNVEGENIARRNVPT